MPPDTADTPDAPDATVCVWFLVDSGSEDEDSEDEGVRRPARAGQGSRTCGSLVCSFVPGEEEALKNHPTRTSGFPNLGLPRSCRGDPSNPDAWRLNVVDSPYTIEELPRSVNYQ